MSALCAHFLSCLHFCVCYLYCTCIALTPSPPPLPPPPPMHSRCRRSLSRSAPNGIHYIQSTIQIHESTRQDTVAGLCCTQLLISCVTPRIESNRIKSNPNGAFLILILIRLRNTYATGSAPSPVPSRPVPSIVMHIAFRSRCCPPLMTLAHERFRRSCRLVAAEPPLPLATPTNRSSRGQVQVE